MSLVVILSELSHFKKVPPTSTGVLQY